MPKSEPDMVEEAPKELPLGGGEATVDELDEAIWAPSAKGKKGKKGKKAKKQQAFNWTEAGDSELQDPELTKDMPTEAGASTQPEDASKVREMVPEQPTEMQEDESFALAGKKSKKDKKNAKKSKTQEQDVQFASQEPEVSAFATDQPTIELSKPADPTISVPEKLGDERSPERDDGQPTVREPDLESFETPVALGGTDKMEEGARDESLLTPQVSQGPALEESDLHRTLSRPSLLQSEESLVAGPDTTETHDASIDEPRDVEYGLLQAEPSGLSKQATEETRVTDTVMPEAPTTSAFLPHVSSDFVEGSQREHEIDPRSEPEVPRDLDTTIVGGFVPSSHDTYVPEPAESAFEERSPEGRKQSVTFDDHVDVIPEQGQRDAEASEVVDFARAMEVDTGRREDSEAFPSFPSYAGLPDTSHDIDSQRAVLLTSPEPPPPPIDEESIKNASDPVRQAANKLFDPSSPVLRSSTDAPKEDEALTFVVKPSKKDKKKAKKAEKRGVGDDGDLEKLLQEAPTPIPAPDFEPLQPQAEDDYREARSLDDPSTHGHAFDHASGLGTAAASAGAGAAVLASSGRHADDGTKREFSAIKSKIPEVREEYPAVDLPRALNIAEDEPMHVDEPEIVHDRARADSTERSAPTVEGHPYHKPPTTFQEILDSPNFPRVEPVSFENDMPRDVEATEPVGQEDAPFDQARDIVRDEELPSSAQAVKSVPEEEDGAGSFASLSRKKSKKDKKKSKKAKVGDWEEEEGETGERAVPEESARGMDIVENTDLKAPEMSRAVGVEEPVVAKDEELEEAVELVTRKSSKKGKKKTKAAREVEFEDDAPMVDDAFEPLPEAAQDTIMAGDDLGHEPTHMTQDIGDVGPREAEDLVEEDFGQVSGKKGKKGKKKRKEKQASDLPEQSPEDIARSLSLKGTAKTAGTVGAGVAIFEGMQRAATLSEKQKEEFRRARRASAAARGEVYDEIEEPFLEEPRGLERGRDDRERSLSPRQKADHRDSALHMPESPFPAESSIRHPSVRDSGYQGIDDSPILGEEIPRTPTELEDIEHYDHRGKGKRRSKKAPEEHPLHVSIETSPDYDVSITSPRGVHVQEEDLHDVDELPSYSTRQVHHPSPAKSHIDREPSPVDSMTKDRSAALFSSSPSTRDHPTASAASKLHGREEPEHDAADVPPGSLFGGPVGINSDRASMRSPPQTPMPYGSAGHPLTTIAEQSPDASPLLQKSREAARAKEAEHGGLDRRRSRRAARSPHTDGPRQLGMISTDDLITRLSWPDVNEENHSVDLERSRSRPADKDRKPSLQRKKKLSLSTDPDRHDGERRSTSGASIKSQESINAIIRSPPMQAADAPPPHLRRASRSVSSDLRAASKRSEPRSEPSSVGSDAKRSKDARPGKASPVADVDLDRGVPVASSSTYDPVTDKGKGRITKMTDIYVSFSAMKKSLRID